MSLRIDHENTEKEPLMFVASGEYTTVTGKLLFFIPMTEFFVYMRGSKCHYRLPCVQN